MSPATPVPPGRRLSLRERRRLRTVARGLARDDPGLAGLLGTPSRGPVDHLLRCVPGAAVALALAGILLAQGGLLLLAIVIATIPAHRWMQDGPPLPGEHHDG